MHMLVASKMILLLSNKKECNQVPGISTDDGQITSTSLWKMSLTLICRVDYSILINWMSPFLFLVVADVVFSSYFL